MATSSQMERLHFHFSLSCIREGNGNPLQCSCLENPRDSEAWWAAVYGVAQSRTRLMRLSSSSRSSSQAEVGHSREIVMLVVVLLLVVTKMHLEHQMFVKKELDKMLHK